MEAGLKPRLNIVTLGVHDMPIMRGFYERLGLTASSASNDHVTFFQLGAIVLALFGYEALAHDAETMAGPPTSYRGFSMAWNAESRAQVDSIMTLAAAVGATIRKGAQEVFWGGYSGYFADPEGNLWEVAHNPFFPFDEHGRLVLP